MAYNVPNELLTVGVLVVVFVLVTLPWTYGLTNNLLGKCMKTWENDKPTTAGYVVHLVVFALLALGVLYIPWEKVKGGSD